MKKEIYYATSNSGKFEEVKRFLEKHEANIIVKQFDEDLPEIQTMDQKAIAIDKAKKAWAKLKKPVLIDDSGIYFDAYNKFPGTLTKFIYHGLGYEGLLKLVEDNTPTPRLRRTSNRATFLLHMIYTEKENEHHTFEGQCNGQIIRPQKFDAHPKLPYDAIFLPDGSDGKTYAELRGTPEEKKFAYRLRALQSFLKWYEAQI